MAGTFISYRREDAAGYAGRLRESLERRIGTHRVFRDVDALLPGQDFVQAIEARLAECRVMLVVIGREWLDARSSDGKRRLDDAYDFVRLEIAAGLARPDVLVVPVLVEGAAMPAAADLPENIRPLARRHAVSVRDETWDADVDRLVAVIDNAESTGGPVRGAWPARHLRLALAAGVVVAIVLVAFVLLWGSRPKSDAPASDPSVSNSGAPGIPSVSSSATAPAFTIAVPRIAEAAFGNLIYTVVSGNVVFPATERELRLRIRLMNYSHYDANFWDASFRLVLGGETLSPTSNLNMIVPGNSLRYAIVTFRVPLASTGATLRIENGDAHAAIPLELSQTGRPPVDEGAEIADSSSQAITAVLIREPVALIDGNELSVSLLKASTRRFANAVRVRLSVRFENRGRYPIHSGALTMRVAAGGEHLAPGEFPNEAIAPKATVTKDVVFDLPTTTTRATLRSTIGNETAERAFDTRDSWVR
jgi:hypothetical protein